VLVEEFGGVRCVGCPAGHSLIKELQGIYRDKLVVVSLHTGSFALPYAENRFDFRLPENDRLLLELGRPVGYPVAAINRRLFDGESSRMLSPPQWAGYLAQAVNRTTPLRLTIASTPSANPALAACQVELGLVRDTLLPSLQLSVMLVEDQITDVQLTPSGKQPDYVHQNVLRSWLTPSSGQPVPSPTRGSPGKFSFTVPIDPTWNRDRLRWVALVQAKSPTSLEVLQVSGKKM